MKILIIFMDMLRTDFLNLYDNKLSETPLDIYFKKMNGTLYNNIYTPCPDTARSLSTFFSGKPCFENGCNKRGKYPGQFLSQTTILDALKQNGYSIKLYTNRNRFIFPKRFQEERYYLESLDNIDLKDNSFTFVDIPDVHHVLDDFGALKKSVEKAHIQLKNSLDYLFKKISYDDFDKIIYFSDHGHMLKTERVLDFDDEHFIGDARSRIFFYEKSRDDDNFRLNNTFSSIAYFSAYLSKTLNLEGNYDFGNKYIDTPEKNLKILIEDFKSVRSGINQVPNLWGIKTAKNLVTFNSQSIQNIDLDTLEYWPHLKQLRTEYIVYNEYLKFSNQKKNDYIANKYYFDGTKRVNSIEKNRFVRLNKTLKKYMPGSVYRNLRKIANNFYSKRWSKNLKPTASGFLLDDKALIELNNK